MTHPGSMNEKSIVNDCLVHLKSIMSGYDKFIQESASPDLRKDLLGIYQEEQDNAFRVFRSMSDRGWYPVQMADPAMLNQLKSQMQSQRQQPGAL